MTMGLRRVVTRRGADGDRIVEDGPPLRRVDIPGGVAVAELLWLAGPARTIDDGGDRDEPGFPLEPPAGGLSSRLVRLPPADGWLRVDGDSDAEPGMHATDTLDLVLVLDGEITLGTEHGEYRLGAGDAVVQQGAPHRWRVEGDGPCTYWVTMLRPAPGEPPPPLARNDAAVGVRRVVTTAAADGDGKVAPSVATDGFSITQVWQTNGPLTSVLQGGDPAGGWELEPRLGGTAMSILTLAPAGDGEGFWHETATIDIDLIVAGRVRLELPDDVVELGPGDVVVQRGTDHRWVVPGPEPLTMATVMVAVG